MAPDPEALEAARVATPLPQKIGFVGGGQMAIALGQGFMAAGLISPSQVLASAPSDTNLTFWRQLGARTTHANAEIVRTCDVIFLAVKPHILPQVVGQWQEEVRQGSDDVSDVSADHPPTFLCPDSKLFVSVLAGATTDSLYERLSSVVPNPRIVRVNPNTPAMLGCGASGFSLGRNATEEDSDLVRRLLSSVGLCEMIPESQQDAFTGLVTSGPAYVYTLIEGLADGGVRMGLPRRLANTFAAQMVLGAAKMCLETGKHTGQLKDEVTSPGGTTIRGIQVIDRAGVRGTLMDAVQASAERATELGRGSK